MVGDGPSRFLDALESKAQDLFVGTVFSQFALGVAVVLLHLSINWLVKRKLKRVPEALAFPRFELGQFMAMFEGMVQTSLVTLAATGSQAPSLAVRLGAGAWLAVLLGAVLWLFRQVKWHADAQTIRFEEAPLEGRGCLGAVEMRDIVYRYTVLPPSIFFRRLLATKLDELGLTETKAGERLAGMLTEPKEAETGAWAPDESDPRVARFVGGYAELFEGCTSLPRSSTPRHCSLHVLFVACFASSPCPHTLLTTSPASISFCRVPAKSQC